MLTYFRNLLEVHQIPKKKNVTFSQDVDDYDRYHRHNKKSRTTGIKEDLSSPFISPFPSSPPPLIFPTWMNNKGKNHQERDWSYLYEPTPEREEYVCHYSERLEKSKLCHTEPDQFEFGPNCYCGYNESNYLFETTRKTTLQVIESTAPVNVKDININANNNYTKENVGTDPPEKSSSLTDVLRDPENLLAFSHLKLSQIEELCNIDELLDSMARFLQDVTPETVRKVFTPRKRKAILSITTTTDK